MRVAFSSIALKTGSSSPGEELITRSTSEVAVCCSQQFREITRALTQFVKQRGVLDCDHRLSGEVRHQRDLPVSEWTNFLPVDHNRASQLSFPEHGHSNV